MQTAGGLPVPTPFAESRLTTAAGKKPMSDSAADPSPSRAASHPAPNRPASGTAGPVVHEIHWSDAFPWWNLFAAAGRAFAPAVLLLATAGFVSTWAGWSVADRIVQAVGCETAVGRPPSPSAAAFPGARALLDTLPRPLVSAAATLVKPFDPGATLAEVVVALLRIGWFVVVWSIFGTAITRYAALRSVGEESRGLFGSFAYGLAKWPAAFNAAAFVLLGMLLLSLPGALLGLFMRFDWGLAAVATIWPAVLAGGLLVAILALGLAAGWPLMVACIGVERGDSFQAISSGFSYVFQRPLHLAFYVAVAAVVLVPASLAAAVIVDATSGLSVWATSWGMGHERTKEVLEGMARLAAGEPSGAIAASGTAWGAAMLDFWRRCLTALVGAFLWAYFWSVATAIYLLLRRDVDGTELDEIVLNELPGEG